MIFTNTLNNKELIKGREKGLIIYFRQKKIKEIRYKNKRLKFNHC